MVLLTAAGILLTLVASWFLVTSVASILNILVVVAAVGGGVALFYQLYRMRPLELSEASSIVTYASLGTATGFILFRVLQHLVSAVSFGVAAVIGLLVVGSIVLSPQIVAGILKSLFEFVAAFFSE